jgi:hypothetical protein
VVEKPTRYHAKTLYRRRENIAAVCAPGSKLRKKLSKLKVGKLRRENIRNHVSQRMVSDRNNIKWKVWSAKAIVLYILQCQEYRWLGGYIREDLRIKVGY